ncbi:MAG: hypothetical protein JO321_11980 [Solirubrobacterales bacterium]|nr:hypothetical protein [Solirubrobacterales bacterium]
MPRALKPEASRMGGVVFELDRFELATGNRCRLRGRWFGVRGRRFMRPALTLIGEGRRTRLLADLTNKPWVAEDGEPWEAVFEGDLQDVDLVQAELSVTPDITIMLPVCDTGAGAKQSTAGTRLTRPSRGPPTGALDAGEELDQTQQAEEDLVRGRLAVLTRQLVEAQNDLRRVRRQLAHAEAEKARGGTRMDALLGELDELRRARDQTQERFDQFAAEQHVAHEARATAEQSGERARSARDRAVAERNAVSAQRDQAIAERDRAVTERDAAASARDAALATRDEAVSERDQFKAEGERLQSELKALRASSGAALVMRHATRARGGSHYRSAIAVIALIAVLAVALGLAIAFVVL